MTRMSRTRRRMPSGSTDAAWSEPHMARSRVMCRSTMTAPMATAATVVCRPTSWPEYPIGTLGYSASRVLMQRRFSWSAGAG